MQADEMILVSCDDHVVEPRDMFEGHVPGRWREQAPRSVIKENGIETWVFQRLANKSSNKISWQNTCRLFQFGPFAHTPMTQANVGALRALAADVDTTVRSKEEWRKQCEAAI